MVNIYIFFHGRYRFTTQTKNSRPSAMEHEMNIKVRRALFNKLRSNQPSFFVIFVLCRYRGKVILLGLLLLLINVTKNTVSSLNMGISFILRNRKLVKLALLNFLAFCKKIQSICYAFWYIGVNYWKVHEWARLQISFF